MRGFIALFLITSIAAPATGVFPTVSLLGIWAAWLFWQVPEQQTVALPRPLLLFVLALALLTAIEHWAWRPERDLGDVIQQALFLGIIPSMLYAGARRRAGHLGDVASGATIAFWGVTFAVICWVAVAGVDWNRNTFFHPALHKNGVSAGYEVLAFFAIAHARQHAGPWIRITAVALGGMLLIGSKTGLVLLTLFLVGLVARWAFVAAAVPVVVAGAYLLTQLSTDSPLRTASQRLIMWLQAWLEITESSRTIIFGNGPGTYVSAIDFQGLEGIAGTHNFLLQVLHNFGVLGTALYAAYFLWLWRIGRGIFTFPALGAIWLFNTHALFDVGWVSGAGTLASVILGLGIAEACRTTETARRV